MQFGLGAVLHHPMLSRERLQSLGRAQRGDGIAAHISRYDFQERIGNRRDVADLGRAAVRRVDQFARAVDLAQLPHRYGKPGHRRQVGVVAETFARLPIALRVASVERALAMGPRFNKFSVPIARPMPRPRLAMPASMTRPASSASRRSV